LIHGQRINTTKLTEKKHKKTTHLLTHQQIFFICQECSTKKEAKKYDETIGFGNLGETSPRKKKMCGLLLWLIDLQFRLQIDIRVITISCTTATTKRRNASRLCVVTYQTPVYSREVT
jgi:hypothetical protein